MATIAKVRYTYVVPKSIPTIISEAAIAMLSEVFSRRSWTRTLPLSIEKWGLSFFSSGATRQSRSCGTYRSKAAHHRLCKLSDVIRRAQALKAAKTIDLQDTSCSLDIRGLSAALDRSG